MRPGHGDPTIIVKINAKDLSENLLEALQYANVGQGTDAGFAMLFCAMIRVRIVQGDWR